MGLVVLPAVPGQGQREQVERPQPTWGAALGSCRMWGAVDMGCSGMGAAVSYGMHLAVECCQML